MVTGVTLSTPLSHDPRPPHRVAAGCAHLDRRSHMLAAAAGLHRVLKPCPGLAQSCGTHSAAGYGLVQNGQRSCVQGHDAERIMPGLSPPRLILFAPPRTRGEQLSCRESKGTTQVLIQAV